MLSIQTFTGINVYSFSTQFIIVLIKVCIIAILFASNELIYWTGMELVEENESNIFFLGLAILFGWMFVICICASPQLFRDFIIHNLCCCMLSASKIERYNDEKIKQAQERVRSASKSFLNTSLTANPSVFLLHQVMGPNTPTSSHPTKHVLIEMPPCLEPVPEESRGTSLQPNSEDGNRSTPFNQEEGTRLL